jgi:hypothetical protein
MNNSPISMTMNVKEFSRVLAQVNEASSRTYPEFVNGQAYRLALDAYLHTPWVGEEKIALQLGRIGTQFRNKRTGANLKKRKAIYSSKASLDLYRIVNWRRKRGGQKPLGGKEMSKVARAARAAMIRSGGFIGGGWLYAVNKLKRIVRDSKSAALNHKVKMSGQDKGWANPASFTLNGVVTCEIGNSALLQTSSARTGKRPGKPFILAQKGLEIARYHTAQNMLAHLAEKLQPVLTKHSA